MPVKVMFETTYGMRFHWFPS